MKIFITATLLAIGGAFYGKNFIAPQQHLEIKAVAKPPYDSVKTHITQLRLRLKNTADIDTTLLQKYFVSTVIDSIIPYWYGTPWDFNGITQTPGKGAIACGYFVSTVLRDAGLNISRVKMGQSDSEGIIHSLAEKKNIKLFYDKPLNIVIGYINSRGAGLYIIGLDCHVGFILKDEKGCWFIHSKWYDERAVMKEEAATSSILYNSKYKMIGKISNNSTLLKAWVNGTRIGL
jgi:hypothetical protein